MIRYQIAVNGDDADAFKCNNNFTSCYARKFIFENPHLSDFFETRKSKKPAEAKAEAPLQTIVSTATQAGRLLAGLRHKKTNTKTGQKYLFKV